MPAEGSVLSVPTGFLQKRETSASTSTNIAITPCPINGSSARGRGVARVKAKGHAPRVPVVQHLVLARRALTQGRQSKRPWCLVATISAASATRAISAHISTDKPAPPPRPLWSPPWWLFPRRWGAQHNGIVPSSFLLASLLLEVLAALRWLVSARCRFRGRMPIAMACRVLK